MLLTDANAELMLTESTLAVGTIRRLSCLLAHVGYNPDF